MPDNGAVPVGRPVHFLTLLPILLIILGYSIIVLAVYIVYKAWLEEPVLNLIQKLKSRRNG